MSATVYATIDEVHAARWDHVVRVSGAPIFYRHCFLSAVMAHPLQEVLEARFLLFEKDGEPWCSVPVFRVATASSIVADSDGGTEPSGGLWVSHTAHWYDSCLPAVVDAGLALDALSHALMELCVPRLLLQNVADPALVAAAAARGYACRGYDRRYRLDLTPYAGYDAWVDARGRATRRNLRRVARRAAELGWTIESLPVGAAELDRVIALCRQSTAKHGNIEWLPAACMRGFLRRLPTGMAVAHQLCDHAGRIVAAAAGFHDGPVYHSWSGGVDADLTAGSRVDANLLLYQAELGWAFTHGCDVFEGGRRSAELKLRLGLHEVPLSAIDVRCAPCTY